MKTLALLALVLLSGCNLTDPDDSVFMLTGDRGSCTGFQVKAPSGKLYIMTARHCSDLSSTGVITVVHEDGSLGKSTIAFIDAASDSMLLTADSAALPFNIGKDIRAKDEITAITHPLAGPLVHSLGEFTWYEMVHTDQFNLFEGYGLLPGTAPGSSGGPVFNSLLQIVGIISAGNDFQTTFVTLSDIQRFLSDK